MATPKTDEVINILEVKQESLWVNLLGTTPLISNRVSEKALRELLNPSGRKTAAEKVSSLKHDPIAEFRASPYTLTSGPTFIALPAVSFKAAMGTAALDLPGATKSKVGRLTYVEGEYIPIFGIPKLLMSVVRNSDMNHTPDIRSRAIFPEWACTIELKYVTPIFRQVDVANLLAAAGITAGVGDWRVQKGSSNYGCFKIVRADDPDFVRITESQGRKVQQLAMVNPESHDTMTEDLLKWFMETTTAKGFAPTSPNGVVHEETEEGMPIA